VEDRGVDEVYIDFTDVPGGQREGGRVLARLIQKAIFDATGLTCSIGVAPNKLIAKMASEFNKPTAFPSSTKPTCRKDLAAGRAQDQRHRAEGRREAAQAAPAHHRRHRRADAGWLVDNFGQAYGAWMHEAAWGRDDRPVVTESEPVSMSRETTFDRDLHAVRDRAELGAIFTDLCTRVAEDLQRKGYVGQDHRHQAALRRLQDRHARPDLDTTPPTAPPSAARPASASSACRWTKSCACWACARPRWPGPHARQKRQRLSLSATPQANRSRTRKKSAASTSSRSRRPTRGSGSARGPTATCRPPATTHAAASNTATTRLAGPARRQQV
jgi:nucleotidyltransferase/DNA polymerase involved in DNA repair